MASAEEWSYSGVVTHPTGSRSDWLRWVAIYRGAGRVLHVDVPKRGISRESAEEWAVTHRPSW